MPRGQKSKLRAREKRRQAREETQSLQGARVTAMLVKEAASSSLVPGDCPESSPAAGPSQESWSTSSSPTPTAAVCRPKSEKEAKGPKEERPGCSRAPASTDRSHRDPLTRKAFLLLQFLLHKYKTKQPILKAEMLKIISRKYKEQFPEILKRSCERLELVFGLDLKEADASGQSYTLVSKLDLSHATTLSGGWGFPKTGLLMPLLGMIFMNGNCAPEEEIWEFLSLLGIHDGRRHFIFGDPRKLITQDLVQEKYLEYRQVAHSDPPRYEFLWGPRAHAETSKMKVLEFLAKVNDTVPSAFHSHYEEALHDEEERAQARAAARAMARAQPGRGQAAVGSAYGP
ncbi:melanoma-associated antigen B1-like [Choloepus didactylus]|uniref:melanoma-associated antigen B1-like n=1 Tax=Choloepus didactylus TaxID=27675 RepID=UPI00189CB288|nr:melanoma-associated antigen B1-like [Choloepus didactylus]